MVLKAPQLRSTVRDCKKQEDTMGGVGPTDPKDKDVNKDKTVKEPPSTDTKTDTRTDTKTK